MVPHPRSARPWGALIMLGVLAALAAAGTAFAQAGMKTAGGPAPAPPGASDSAPDPATPPVMRTITAVAAATFDSGDPNMLACQSPRSAAERAACLRADAAGAAQGLASAQRGLASRAGPASGPGEAAVWSMIAALLAGIEIVGLAIGAPLIWAALRQNSAAREALDAAAKAVAEAAAASVEAQRPWIEVALEQARWEAAGAKVVCHFAARNVGRSPAHNLAIACAPHLILKDARNRPNGAGEMVWSGEQSELVDKEIIKSARAALDCAEDALASGRGEVVFPGETFRATIAVPRPPTRQPHGDASAIESIRLAVVVAYGFAGRTGQTALDLMLMNRPGLENHFSPFDPALDAALLVADKTWIKDGTY